MTAETPSTHAWGTQPEMFGPRHEHRLGMIIREVDRHLGARSRVLDGAVGLGQLAVRMQRRERRVFGIDYSFDAALHCRRTTTIPVVVGDMTRMPFRDGVFDGVTTGETLEHLDDDASAAREIGRVLREDGTCIATVPALQSLWSASDDYYEHRRRYSRAQLAAMFRAAGLSIVRALYWGFPVVLTYDTLFLLPMNKRRARRKVTEDAALQSVAKAGKSRALVRLVRAVFGVDALFQWLPFGPGLLMVAKKKS
ncbi:MAG TPA: methyltransferase domain-containing protein [Thermoanaerobaculia bacterium]|nr:methyltransferase domain-containing protein [Thermoanaerobaculia bacterium]